MEPENVADYNKVEYWDRRYRQEDRYDWFSSVYGDTVKALGSLLVSVAKQKSAVSSSSVATTAPQSETAAAGKESSQGTSTPKVVSLNVLHLGCGNSALCWDLAEYVYRTNAAETSSSSSAGLTIQLNQTALDYSQVVIDAMSAADVDELAKRCTATGEGVVAPNPTTWVVGDIRQLQVVFPFTDPTAATSSSSSSTTTTIQLDPTFDVVIDKGTMDALQADKENDRMEEDIEEMLVGVSHLLKHTPSGSLAVAPWSTFVQVTWETPYYRKHYTMKEEGHFIWDKVSTKLLGESDMYRVFVYTH